MCMALGAVIWEEKVDIMDAGREENCEKAEEKLCKTLEVCRMIWVEFGCGLQRKWASEKEI